MTNYFFPTKKTTIRKNIFDHISMNYITKLGIRNPCVGTTPYLLKTHNK